MWKKHRKKIIGGVIVIVTLAVIVVIGISGYVGSSLTQPEREALTTTRKKRKDSTMRTSPSAPIKTGHVCLAGGCQVRTQN